MVLTFDVDWAPDYMIEPIVNTLLEYNVKSTWFITHNSPTLSIMREHPNLFELGIHPNFNNNSTHGNSIDDVLLHCKNLVPEAITMRTHGLFQSSNILFNASCNFDIEYDSSIFLPYTSNICNHDLKLGNKILRRLPYFLGDYYHSLCKNKALLYWNLENVLNIYSSGLKIFNFHPIHIYLNSINKNKYEILKKKYDINTASIKELVPYVNENTPGIETLFKQIVLFLAENDGGKTIKEL